MGRAREDRPYFFTVLVVATSLPFLVVLCTTLWRTPYPIRDSVGIFEDVAERPASTFLTVSTSYYRPLFFLTLSAMWHGADSIDAALRSIRLLHIVPVIALVLAFIWQLRPKRVLDAAAAMLAVSVLVGSAGFLGNLEVPLSYTIVGMPAALIVWMLLERDPRVWYGPAIIALTVIAVGFKEQGLVIVPVVLLAWWMGAPGAGRLTAASVAVMGAAYVVFRLTQHGGSWPPFEQDIGLGFGAYSSAEAGARFGAFPLWIYAYNAGSTIANVLFAEPTDGVFQIVRAMIRGQLRPWHLVYLVSSVVLTTLIVWWSVGTLRRAPDRKWSPESRLAIALILVLGACGALSFDYSRERLGAMAVPFYALAAYCAVRAAAERALRASRATAAIAAVTLLLLAGAWQLRALYTIEFTRQRTVNNHKEWITDLRRRHAEFSTRKTYIHILDAMTAQGTNPDLAVQRTRYPRWMFRMMGEY
jgi:hypothetical protein